MTRTFTRTCLAGVVAIAVLLFAAPPTPAADVKAADIAKLTKTVTVDGLAFPVVDAGNGPVVLMLHGFPDSRYLWRYQIQALMDAGFRVIAPDLRGFGDAPRPQDASAYGIDPVIKDVLGILDALQIKRVQLVAHDVGAVVGWRLASQHPDRVERYASLSIGAPGPRRNSIQQREKTWYIAFFQQKTAEEELMRDDWWLFREWQKAKGEKEAEWDIKLLSRPGALTAALNWYRSPNRAQYMTTPLAPMTMPVLGIWSDGDAYVVEDGLKTTGERVKGPFRYEKITGASHWMQIEKPAEVNRLLLGFLTLTPN